MGILACSVSVFGCSVFFSGFWVMCFSVSWMFNGVICVLACLVGVFTCSLGVLGCSGWLPVT